MSKSIQVTVENADGVRDVNTNRFTSDSAREIIEEFLGYHSPGENADDYLLLRQGSMPMRQDETLREASVVNHETLTVVRKADWTDQPPPPLPPPPPPSTLPGPGLSTGAKIFLVVIIGIIGVLLYLVNNRQEVFDAAQTQGRSAESKMEVEQAPPPAIPTFGPPILSSPINDELVRKDQPIQLRWQEVPNAVKYSLKVNNANDEEILLIHLSGTDYELNQYRMETEDGTISWSVNAIDGQGRESGWSKWARFTLAESDQKPPVAQAPASDNPPAQEQKKAEKYLPFPDDEKCAPSRLHVGDRASVKPEAKSLYIRCYPDTSPSNNILYSVKPSEEVEIIGGPECNYGWILWQVRCDSNRKWRDAVCQGYRSCWVAETDKGDEFWLEPVGPRLAAQPKAVSSTCPDNASVHLSVGARGKIVFSDVSLRTSAEVPSVPDENVIVILKQGAGLTVIGGPTCAYNGTWWQVETDAGDTGWVRELLSDKRLVELSNE